MNNSPGPSHNANKENQIGNKKNILSDVDLFKEICGIDETIAIALLRESGGNLEAAIHQYFFTRDNPEVLQNQDNEIHELRRRVFDGNIDGNNQQDQTLPVVPVQQSVLSWSQWIRGIALIPFRYFYTTAMDVFFFVFNFFFGVPSNRRPISGNTRQNPRAVREPNVMADRIIMREQQQAYEQALAIDKQKTEQRKMEEKRAQEEADKETNRKEFLSLKRREMAAKLRAESCNKGDDLVQIRISFPSCARMEKNFRHSDSLERLFEAVFLHPDCPDNFSLFTNFPFKQLNCAPDWYWRKFCADDLDENYMPIGTFADAELFKSANVVVRDNDA